MENIWYFLILTFLSCGLSDANICTAQGRFPDDSIPDCQGYVICIKNVDSTFTSYFMKCPQNSIFIPVDSRCSQGTLYQCYPLHPSFKCTEFGNFENRDSENCVTYIACLPGLNNTMEPRIIDCPLNTIFDLTQSTCVSSANYTCTKEELHYVNIESNKTVVEDSVVSTKSWSVTKTTMSDGAKHLCFSTNVLIVVMFVVFLYNKHVIS